jgi:broad specificity phosphatase PhoE
VSTLTLIRHGQAQVFQRETAALSSLGEWQARKLAEYWTRQNVSFDEIWCGSLPRQARTAEVIAEHMSVAKRPWPAATVDPAWNEYDATGVLRNLAPADPHLAALAAEFEQSRGGPGEHRAFQRLLAAAMTCWLEGTVEGDDYERWPAFQERISGALQRILEGPPGRRVAVFTSGGPIGFSVHRAMRAPAQTFLDVNWRIRNCSITEFLFDRSRFTLDSFNGIPHLDDASLRSYR